MQILYPISFLRDIKGIPRIHTFVNREFLVTAFLPDIERDHFRGSAENDKSPGRLFSEFNVREVRSSWFPCLFICLRGLGCSGGHPLSFHALFGSHFADSYSNV